jgi:hypothetical protein
LYPDRGTQSGNCQTPKGRKENGCVKAKDAGAKICRCEHRHWAGDVTCGP